MEFNKRKLAVLREKIKTVNETEFKIHDKKKLYMVVDVETIGVAERLCYDISWAICDKDGNKYAVRSYLVREVFNDMPTMEKAYYFKKYPKYIELLDQGVYTLKNASTIVDLMNADIEKFKPTIFTAYNSKFDLGALFYTFGRLNSGFVNLPETKECIWAYATNVLMDRWSYRKFAKRHDLKTASGKFWSSNAENCYKYITDNPTFEEEHIGLFDILIEMKILAYCNRQRTKCDKTPSSMCWRIMKIDPSELEEEVYSLDE